MWRPGEAAAVRTHGRELDEQLPSVRGTMALDVCRERPCLHAGRNLPTRKPERRSRRRLMGPPQPPAAPAASSSPRPGLLGETASPSLTRRHVRVWRPPASSRSCSAAHDLYTILEDIEHTPARQANSAAPAASSPEAGGADTKPRPCPPTAVLSQSRQARP